MSQLSRSSLVTLVQDFIPDKPYAQVARAANLAITRIYNEVPFQSRSTFTTTAPITSGTMTTVTSGLTVTNSGTPFTSGAVYLVQIEGDSTWFTATAVGSTSVLTLSSAWTQTGASGLTYTAVSPVIALPSTVLQPIELRLEGDRPLRFAPDEAPEALNERYSTGRPRLYTNTTINSSDSPDDAYRIMLIPAPDAKYAVTYTYWVRPTFYSTAGGGDASTSSLPALWDTALLYGTLFHCWDQEDKQDRSKYWLERFEAAIRSCKAHRMSNVSTEVDDTSEGGIWAYETRPIV